MATEKKQHSYNFTLMYLLSKIVVIINDQVYANVYFLYLYCNVTLSCPSNISINLSQSDSRKKNTFMYPCTSSLKYFALFSSRIWLDTHKRKILKS